MLLLLVLLLLELGSAHVSDRVKANRVFGYAFSSSDANCSPVWGLALGSFKILDILLTVVRSRFLTLFPDRSRGTPITKIVPLLVPLFWPNMVPFSLGMILDPNSDDCVQASWQGPFFQK